MSAPSVRLLLKGQLLDEVPFRGPMLRIGRMKENEVVINNLSVSRFHATLSREGDDIVLRDLGSENGCWVNGHRVTESRVGPADSIQIGKHQLEIVAGAGSGTAAESPAPRGRSDAWDAANTYLVGPETQARMLGQAAPEAAAPVLDDAPLAAELADPVGDGVELFGDGEPGDLGGADLAEFDVSELEVDAEPLDAELVAAPEAPLDAVDEEATLLVEDAPLQTPAVDPAAAPAPARLHAGVIVQRGGKLENVVAWEGERLTLGRAADCDVVLGTAEVSRRHALLVREGDRYEVRDLESINGTYVNKERVSRRALQVGDVIRIEDFEMTFVLDRSPLVEAVQAAPAAPAAPVDSGGLTQLGEVLDLAPFAADAAGAANAMSFDVAEPELEPEAPAEVLEPAAEAPALEPAAAPLALSFDAEASAEDLLVEDELLGGDDDKDLASAPVEVAVAATPTVRFELAVRLDELPPALREALASLDESDLRLPVELRLARE